MCPKLAVPITLGNWFGECGCESECGMIEPQRGETFVAKQSKSNMKPPKHE